MRVILHRDGKVGGWMRYALHHTHTHLKFSCSPPMMGTIFIRTPANLGMHSNPSPPTMTNWVYPSWVYPPYTRFTFIPTSSILTNLIVHLILFKTYSVTKIKLIILNLLSIAFNKNKQNWYKLVYYRYRIGGYGARARAGKTSYPPYTSYPLPMTGMTFHNTYIQPLPIKIIPIPIPTGEDAVLNSYNFTRQSSLILRSMRPMIRS